MVSATLRALILVSIGCAVAPAQAEREQEFYRLLTYEIPEGVVLEVGGIDELPGGRLAVSSRRGEIWIVENAFAEDVKQAKFKRFAHGLHEVLGLVWRDGWLYAMQRGELTRIKDADNDGEADTFENVCDEWGISGDYHEYAFNSKFDKNGDMWLVLCLTGSFTSEAPYRGWAVRVKPDGSMVPTCSGIRSPGGIGMNCAGDMFYCDNQGPWNGSGSLKHLVPGSFQGHPDSFTWYDRTDAAGPRPERPRDKSRFHKEAERIPQYVPPAVILPHGKVGISSSGIACDDSSGKFGPFAGQLFVSDQGHSVVNRVVLEQVKGRYQGVCIPFRQGFGSGNVPTLMARDGSLIVGGTGRGWGSRGGKEFALERVVWTGKVPFEIETMTARPDGFELTFTKPVDPESAGKVESYTLGTYTYIFQAEYGSPEVDATTPKIAAAEVGADRKRVRLRVEGLQIGHVHELTLPGVRAAEGGSELLHPIAYYTLWATP